MHRVEERRSDRVRGGHVVCDPGRGRQLCTVINWLRRALSASCCKPLICAYLPHAQQAYKEIVGKAMAKHLRNNKDITRERALKHNGHV